MGMCRRKRARRNFAGAKWESKNVIVINVAGAVVMNACVEGMGKMKMKIGVKNVRRSRDKTLSRTLAR
jgi:hypothetical protein